MEEEVELTPQEMSIDGISFKQTKGAPNIKTNKEISDYLSILPKRKLSYAVSIINQEDKVINIRNRLRKKLEEKVKP